MDGSLFEPKDPSPYRNGVKPDPKVNDAWEELDSILTFPISADDVRKLGKDPELAVKYPEEYGLGPDAYVAQLDVFHQIHCLNLLRHLAWAEYGRNESHGKKPYSDLHFIHVSHCTEILMQNILCTANTDVITFNVSIPTTIFISILPMPKNPMPLYILVFLYLVFITRI
jgi:hypothetical protein